MQGFVYILVNSSTPGLCKVGKTTRTPADRGAELSAATGVATPFVVAFEQEFDDCDAAEARIHAELDGRGWRVAPNREFFRAPASQIVRVVLDVAEGAPVPGADGPGADATDADAAKRRVRSAQSFLDAGDRALQGTEDTLQDPDQALRCYKQALLRGSVMAFERLGGLLARGMPGSRADRQRALRLLNEGAARGNYYCLAELGGLYARTGHLRNFEKAWMLFFRRRQEAPLVEIETESQRFLTACRYYLDTCLERGLPVSHAACLAPHAADLATIYLEVLDSVRHLPARRAAATTALRWIDETLLPPPPAPKLRRFWRRRRGTEEQPALG